MKTKKQLQNAADEILEVCKKHGILLVGTCESEGIYGEITIGDAEQLSGWGRLNYQIDNTVNQYSENEFSLGGIGQL